MGSYASGQGNILTAGQSIYAESSTQVHTLGARLCLGDGRVFHYAKSGGALAAGKLCASALWTANHDNCAPAAAAAIGSRTVTVTLGATAATADMYKDGTLMVIAGTGLGQTYKIKSNPAADASASCVITLYDELVVALATADSKISLYPNLFNGTTQSSTEEYLHVGVPLIAVTSGYYHWEQTWGLCSVLSGDTAAAGCVLAASSAAGERYTQADFVKDTIGTSFGEAAADGEYNAAFLKLVP